MSAKFYFVVLCACISLSLAEKDDGPIERNLSLAVNPGCDSTPGSDYCQNVTVFHIRSDSENDSLHFIWSFLGAPTLLLARTDLNASLEINWASFIDALPGAIAFDPPEIYYSFGWSIKKVWTYEDENDQVEMDKVNQTNVVGHGTRHFVWERYDQDFVNNSKLIKFSMIATHDDKNNSFGTDGYMKVTVQVRSTDGYGDILPYYRHNANSSQVDIALNKLNVNGSLTAHSRIGLGYLFVQQLPTHQQGNTTDAERIQYKVTKTLDDEHSPGVFEMVSLRTAVVNSYDQCYLEWKPVCYTAEIRDIVDSLDVHTYPLRDDYPVRLDDTALWSFYGKYSFSTLVAQRANISFGTKGDGFYNSTPHVSWSYMTGYGPPPSDSVSLLVILTLAVGLGIPAIIVVMAVIYMFTKKLSTPKDDLLLGR